MQTPLLPPMLVPNGSVPSRHQIQMRTLYAQPWDTPTYPMGAKQCVPTCVPSRQVRRNGPELRAPLEVCPHDATFTLTLGLGVTGTE